MSSDENKPDGNEPRKGRRRFSKPRHRFTYIWIVGFLVVLFSVLTDPDTGLIKELPFGAGTVATLIVLSKGVIYSALLHFTRKGLMDYFDMEEAWNLCKQNPVATALFTVGAGLYTLAMAVVIYAATH